MISTKQLVPLGQLAEPQFCSISPLLFPCVWNIGELWLCPGGTLPSAGRWAQPRFPELEEEAALGVWKAVRRALPLGKHSSVTGVLHLGACLSSITTASSLSLSQGAAFSPAPLSTADPDPHRWESAHGTTERSGVDQADRSALVPHPAGTRVTERMRGLCGWKRPECERGCLRAGVGTGDLRGFLP